MGGKMKGIRAWKEKSQLQEAFREFTHLPIWSKMALAPGLNRKGKCPASGT